MSTATAIITERVRDRVRREQIAVDERGDIAAELAKEELRKYNERALAGAHPLVHDEDAALRTVLAAITGFGAIQPFLDDPDVEEIWINGPTRVFVARSGDPELTDVTLSDGEVRALVERMLQSTGRRIDLSEPFVDASLPDGSRLHVVIPDVTRRWISVNIRKFNSRIRDIQGLVSRGSLTSQAAEFLWMAVAAGLNIVVSGATQAGKTTMVNALLSAVKPSERIVTVEETFELDVDARDVVGMQCRQASIERTGEITLRRLIKESLRMRPDRLIVGEVREAESLDLLIALNAGLPGMATIHANSAREALTKLCTLPLLAGRNIDSSFVIPTVAATVDVVVHCERDQTGTRRVEEILSLTGGVNAGVIETSSLFTTKNGRLIATGSHPQQMRKFERAGLDPRRSLARCDA